MFCVGDNFSRPHDANFLRSANRFFWGGGRVRESAVHARPVAGALPADARPCWGITTALGGGTDGQSRRASILGPYTNWHREVSKSGPPPNKSIFGTQTIGIARARKVVPHPKQRFLDLNKLASWGLEKWSPTPIDFFLGTVKKTCGAHRLFSYFLEPQNIYPFSSFWMIS